MADEEDVVLSAFHSLFHRAKAGQFSPFENRGDLWRLLIKITRAKAINAFEHECLLKRGGQSPESRQLSDSCNVIRQPTVLSAESGTSPDAELVMAEIIQVLLDLLPDDRARQVAQMKLDGYSHQDIMASIPCSRSAVDRRLVVIRRIWSEYWASLHD
jgi:DNA-directed RNA polymerase specialized sigma24 family protein